MDNQGGPLEDLLLQATGRIVQNDFFETNARPYHAHSTHAIMMLQSFAASRDVATGAHNAMDFATLKFASQSLESQQIVPFRRSWEQGDNVSLYGNMAKVMGALTGERLWGDDDWGIGNPAGYALWACLMNYRVPDVLLDYVNRDKSRDASGYWTRAQARFSGEHYKEGRAPKYFNDDGSNFMDRASFKTAPELYFVCPSFVNTWGGRFSRYPVRFDGVWARFAENEAPGAREYDRLARLSTVLSGHRYLDWGDDLAEMSERVMHQHANERYWLGNLSSCYKSFIYAARPNPNPGSSASPAASAISVPWRRHSEDGVRGVREKRRNVLLLRPDRRSRHQPRLEDLRRHGDALQECQPR